MFSALRARRLTGFTLVELLIVLLVLGVLLAIAIPVLLHAQDSAKDAKAKTALNSVYKAAKTVATPHEGRFTYFGYSLAALADDVAASKPGATVSDGTANQGSAVGTVYLSKPASPNDGEKDLLLTTASGSGKLCSLEVHNGALASLSCSSADSAGTTATFVTSGIAHSCAVISGGTVKCWGNNWQGSLGNGEWFDSNQPVQVSGLQDATRLASGAFPNCALRQGGEVRCWGRNEGGALGNGDNNNSNVPVDVQGISGASAISTSDAHSCAVVGSGTVKCWGSNAYGQLGDGIDSHGNDVCGSWVYGNLDCSYAPVEVDGITDATAVSSKTFHSCAIVEGGKVKCWGWNGYGQLGDGTTITRKTPVYVDGISSATYITTGDYNSCAVDGGQVKCWGYNGDNQLGDGDSDHETMCQDLVWSLTDCSKTPVIAGSIDNATAVETFGPSVCALLSTGAVQCWGRGNGGQLGNGGYSSSSTPVPVSNISDATGISVGAEHACAVLSSGSVECWGSNNYGQLGNGSNTSSPVPVSVLLDMKQLTVSHTGPGSTDPDGTVTRAKGASVTITATPGQGSSIASWSGACAGTSASSDTCTVTMDTNKNVSVAFAETKQLTVSKTGHGSVSPSGSSFHAVGANVVITATPGTDESITSWGGACSATANTENTCTVTMDDVKSVSVAFTSDHLPAYDQAVLAESPLVYWKLDSINNDQVADSSGNGVTGSVFGTAATSTTGLVSGSDALLFASGTNGGIVSNSGVDLDRAAWTVEAWIKYSGSCSGGPEPFWLDMYGAWTPSVYTALDCASSEIGWEAIGPTEDFYSTTAFSQNTAHHLVVRVDESDSPKVLSVWVDGQKRYEHSYSGPLRKGMATINLGGQLSYYYPSRPDLTMDEFAIYPSALSDATIANHYALGS